MDFLNCGIPDLKYTSGTNWKTAGIWNATKRDGIYGVQAQYSNDKYIE